MFRPPSLFNRNRNAPALRDRDDADPFYSLHREMNRLFDDFFDGVGFSAPLAGSSGNGARAIHMDVHETKKAYLLEAELPGLDEDDINVELTENMLTIHGEKKHEEDGDGGARRAWSSFRRSMSLPFEVDPDAVEARFKNGMLRLKIPKPPELEAKTRKIEVQRG